MASTTLPFICGFTCALGAVLPAAGAAAESGANSLWEREGS